MWGYGGVVRWEVEVARWRAIQAAKGASGAASETRATERHPSKQPHVHPDDSAKLRATRFVYTNPRHPLRDEVLVEENRPRGRPSQRSVCESEHRRVPRQTTQCAHASPSGVAMSSETKKWLFGESAVRWPALGQSETQGWGEASGRMADWADFGPPAGRCWGGYHLISTGRLTEGPRQGRQLKAANCGAPSPEQRMPR